MTTPTPLGRYVAPVAASTILPPLVPGQAKLDALGFDLPEGTITPNGVRVWAIKRNPATDQPVAWVEAIGRDSVAALRTMIEGIDTKGRAN